MLPRYREKRAIDEQKAHKQGILPTLLRPPIPQPGDGKLREAALNISSLVSSVAWWIHRMHEPREYRLGSSYE